MVFSPSLLGLFSLADHALVPLVNPCLHYLTDALATRCAGCVREPGSPGYRLAPATGCGGAGTPPPLSENSPECRAGEQRGAGHVRASGLCCHPADFPLSTPSCTHGQNVGKPGTFSLICNSFQQAISEPLFS